MSERRTIGSRIHAAREAKGLSIRRAARRLGVSPRTLRCWEHGRESIPLAVREAMAGLYGLPREELIPDRPSEVQREGAMIRIGSVVFTAQGGDDDSLRAFLAAVRQERGLAPGAELAVRASDAELLAEWLGGTAEDIVHNLQRLLGVSEREALELGRWMFRRTAVAGALAMGLLAGAIGTGAFSAGPAAATAAEIGTAATVEALDEPVDPNWAVIGEAAVLYRHEVPAPGN